MPRYVIVGAGAVGVTFAAQLHRAGRDVLLVGRGAQLDALRAGSLRYVTPTGEWTVVLPSAGSPDEVALTTDDVLVLATKTQDAEQALEQWAWQPVTQPDGSTRSAASSIPVITLQNGLDAERSAARRFTTVLGAVLWLPASYVDVGEVLSPAAPAVGVIWLGAYPGGTHPVAGPAASDLRTAGFDVQVVHDIQRWKAAKLLTSVTFALDALYEDTDVRRRAADLLRDEAHEVLVAAGHDIADVTGETTLDLTRFTVHPIGGRPRPGSSTWQSLRRSGSLESDFLNGEIVLLARLAGRDAPANRAVLEQLQDARRRGLAPRSLGDAELLTAVPAAAEQATSPPAGNDVLIDVETLQQQLAGADPPALLDVRWALGDPDGHKHYVDGHLPGAVFVDLDTELAATGLPATTGRHPLPDVTDLQAAARQWGVCTGQPVVVYDNAGSMAAARAWWLLRWAGIEDVRILDGALPAWTATGLPLDQGELVAEPGDVVLSAGHLPVLDADRAAEYGRSAVLLDARAGERYRGEVEPIDPRAGHVPGAVSAPTGDNLIADGHFRPAAELTHRFDELGADAAATVGVYCGSGVTAAHEIAALRIAGIDAALFAGSWSAWSNDEDRPVAVGPA
jgi:thiosulfate/3-mercaptopyruvate sulfurtransferase